MKAEEFSNQFIIKHEFIKKLHHAFIENNIEFLMPLIQNAPFKK